MSREIKQIAEMNEVELAAFMTSVGDRVEQAIPPRTVFMVMLFDESMQAQYISNGVRADLIKILRETANRLELRQTKERVPFEG